MPSVLQPGRGISPNARAVYAVCGQGGRKNEVFAVARASGGLGRLRFVWVRSTARFGVTGVTRDNAGSVLGNCDVLMFSSGNVLLGQTQSDGSGNFSFQGVGVGSVYLVAYKAGAPDVAGTSIRDITPVVI